MAAKNKKEDPLPRQQAPAPPPKGVEHASERRITPALNAQGSVAGGGKIVQETQRTADVRHRLDLAAQAAAKGNFDAAAAYSNAAVNLQKMGNGLNVSLQRVQSAYEQYQGLAIAAKKTPPNGGGGGGGGGGGTSPLGGDETFSASFAAYAPAPDPAPVLPIFTEDKTSTFKNVKVASKDIIVFNESDVNIELMQDLLFEDIAAIELANMSRYDLIDGQEVYYSPIKNLSVIKKRFDPNNIISLSTNNKSSFAIDLISRIGSGTYDGITKGVPTLGQNEIYFYLDGLKEGEIVEIQLVSGGTIDEIGA